MNLSVKLGYSEVDITPKFSIELVGFNRQDNMSKGVLDKLLAQIAIWDDSVKKSCIVTIDSLGFTIELSNILRGAIAKKLNTESGKIMICFSHTHAAPNAAVEKEYFKFVCAQILEGIDRAMEGMSPVKAAWGVAEAEIGVNRRNESGRLDKRIGILKVADAITGQLKLLLLRVTAHANVMTSDNYLISPDFFGTARKLLENKYSCKIMMTQGASGNVRPKYQHANAVLMEEHPEEAVLAQGNPELTKKRFDQSMAALKTMAAKIDEAVSKIFEELIPQPIYRIDIFSVTEIFFADVPAMERAEKIAKDAMMGAGIDGTNWLAEVKRLNMEKIRQQSSYIEVQYFVLNNGCLCGVANEAMCEIALDISQKSHDKLIFFGGYTNGCSGYLPTEEEYQKGGYEVLWSYLIYYIYHGHVMPLNYDTADILAKLVADKWKHINV